MLTAFALLLGSAGAASATDAEPLYPARGKNYPAPRPGVGCGITGGVISHTYYSEANATVRVNCTKAVIGANASSYIQIKTRRATPYGKATKKARWKNAITEGSRRGSGRSMELKPFAYLYSGCVDYRVIVHIAAFSYYPGLAMPVPLTTTQVGPPARICH